MRNEKNQTAMNVSAKAVSERVPKWPWAQARSE